MKTMVQKKLDLLLGVLGGGQSLNLALSNGGMNATVIYYDSLATEPERLSYIHWLVLGIFV